MTKRKLSRFGFKPNLKTSLGFKKKRLFQCIMEIQFKIGLFRLTLD